MFRGPDRVGPPSGRLISSIEADRSFRFFSYLDIQAISSPEATSSPPYASSFFYRESEVPLQPPPCRHCVDVFSPPLPTFPFRANSNSVKTEESFGVCESGNHDRPPLSNSPLRPSDAASFHFSLLSFGSSFSPSLHAESSFSLLDLALTNVFD